MGDPARGIELFSHVKRHQLHCCCCYVQCHVTHCFVCIPVIAKTTFDYVLKLVTDNDD